ncbi:MAG: nitrate/sulfonate/bicarbonate ABC transporter ATP-binding protein [Myxococcota bacterium]|nr:nitrate/sulfonate/bicarbonate ABC transporter ATP-binding protein [Myxococcota bacterium]
MPNEATPAKDEDRALCEARGVSHQFTMPNGSPHLVLDDITVAVQPNEVIALLGPSGCGKSTILRVLAGLIAPTSGATFYHGAPLAGLNPGVAMVFQSFALFPWMTVAENVEAVLKAARLSAPEIASRTANAIRMVGLVGFEEAYPRELSGGMKQRVGMARAFSLNPELLFMDEPFSQVDALTAQSLRAEVLDIWKDKAKNPSSIVMVSHDIGEVAFMADRIVVLSANPGRVRMIVKNDLPRPRDYRSPEIAALVDRLREIITGSELPDEAPSVTRAPAFGPLPDSTTGELSGLLEYLDARGGREDVFHIAIDTHREFGRVITIVKAAELLEFVDTPKRIVELTPHGARFVQGTPDERKTLWRESLLKLGLFKELAEVLARSPKHAVDRDFVLEEIVLRMPSENYEKTFETLVGWARFGNLFAYDEDEQRLFLQ